VTDYEAQEVLRLTHIERKLRGYLKAFADELDALACSLHRSVRRPQRYFKYGSSPSFVTR
jgi:hypothetical protein